MKTSKTNVSSNKRMHSENSPNCKFFCLNYKKDKCHRPYIHILCKGSPFLYKEGMLEWVILK